MLFSGNALVFILLITQLNVSVISFSQVSPATERLLSLPFEDLCQKVGGSGKAKMVWEYLRQGFIDTITYFRMYMWVVNVYFR